MPPPIDFFFGGETEHAYNHVHELIACLFETNLSFSSFYPGVLAEAEFRFETYSSRGAMRILLAAVLPVLSPSINAQGQSSITEKEPILIFDEENFR
jgi:hypothetical protein